ncbi:MAG: MerR family transcriptional regulator [Niameybacter sp.]|uniref:MerR family transcriptional regulator n=1 Tax=Niameybacter sp. TaxID=2033640 RepID=UPI002FC6343A
MKSYYKIGEISKIYGIGKDSLMYYEELGILRPTRGENGYRFYSLEDIWRLNLIKELKSLDFSMKRIKSYLDDRDLALTQEILNTEVVLIDQKITELLAHKQNIIERLKGIEEAVERAEPNEIQMKYIPERKALVLDANITRDEEVDYLIQKLQKQYEDQFHILGNQNIGAVYDYEQVKLGRYNFFQSVFCLLPADATIFNFTLQEGTYVTCQYEGKYKNNQVCLQNIQAYIRNNKHHIIGEPIEIYQIDIHETGKEEEFLTEIQILVE